MTSPLSAQLDYAADAGYSEDPTVAAGARSSYWQRSRRSSSSTYASREVKVLQPHNTKTVAIVLEDYDPQTSPSEKAYRRQPLARSALLPQLRSSPSPLTSGDSSPAQMPSPPPRHNAVLDVPGASNYLADASGAGGYVVDADGNPAFFLSADGGCSDDEDENGSQERAAEGSTRAQSFRGFFDEEEEEAAAPIEVNEKPEAVPASMAHPLAIGGNQETAAVAVAKTGRADPASSRLSHATRSQSVGQFSTSSSALPPIGEPGARRARLRLRVHNWFRGLDPKGSAATKSTTDLQRMRRPEPRSSLPLSSLERPAGGHRNRQQRREEAPQQLRRSDTSLVKNSSDSAAEGVMWRKRKETGMGQMMAAAAQQARNTKQQQQRGMGSRVASFASLSGMFSAELLNHVEEGAKNWNEEWQQMWSDDVRTAGRAEEQTRIANSFSECALQYAKIIISEKCLPPHCKTIKPIDIGGVAGGEKYLVQGILYKFALDAQLAPGVYLFGGSTPCHEAAMKAAGRELTNMTSYATAKVEGLHFPLMCLIDYLGYRVIALSKLPITPDTLRYGSSDGGSTVHADDAELISAMERVGKTLNLSAHLCGADRVPIYGPGDIEGHVGLDGRRYVIDYARVCPPEAPSLNPQLRRLDGRAVFTKMLRPEFVINYYRAPLCSDTFTAWDRADPNRAQHQRDLLEATAHLRQVVIPKCALSIDGWLEKEMNRESSPHHATAHLSARYKALDVSAVLHEHGVNLRHLGRVRSLLSSDSGRLYTLNAAVARVLKNVVFARMRNRMDELGAPVEEPFRLLLADFLNEVLELRHSDLWSTTLPAQLLRRYPGILAPELGAKFAAEDDEAYCEVLRLGDKAWQVLPSSFALLSHVDIAAVLMLFLQLTQTRLRERTLKLIVSGAIDFQLGLSDVICIEPRVRKSHVAYWGEALRRRRTAEKTSNRSVRKWLLKECVELSFEGKRISHISPIMSLALADALFLLGKEYAEDALLLRHGEQDGGGGVSCLPSSHHASPSSSQRPSTPVASAASSAMLSSSTRRLLKAISHCRRASTLYNSTHELAIQRSFGSLHVSYSNHLACLRTLLQLLDVVGDRSTYLSVSWQLEKIEESYARMQHYNVEPDVSERELRIRSKTARRWKTISCLQCVVYRERGGGWELLAGSVSQPAKLRVLEEGETAGEVELKCVEVDEASKSILINKGCAAPPGADSIVLRCETLEELREAAVVLINALPAQKNGGSTAEQKQTYLPML